MSKLEFWNLYDVYSGYYLLIAIIILTISLFVFKLFRLSIYHPACFYIFFNFQFTIIAVIFLETTGYISELTSRGFYGSVVFFFLGFAFSALMMKVIYTICSRGINNPLTNVEVYRSKLVYEIATFVFILSTLVTYLAFGIPLFVESKWSVFASIPFAGIIGRLSDSAQIVIIVLLSVTITKKESLSRLDKFNVISLIIVGVLSAKKMFFLDYFYIFFLTNIFMGYKITRAQSFKVIKFFSILIVLVLGSMYINQIVINDSVINPLASLMKRLAMSGDAQILSMPYNVIDTLNWGENYLSIIFFELKGLFDILGISLSGPSLGVKMMKYHYPYLEANIGPSSTFDVFYSVYFSDVKYFLSFFTGIFVGFFVFVKPIIKNEFSLIFWVFVCLNSYILIYNPQVYISRVIFGMIFISLLWFISRLNFTSKG